MEGDQGDERVHNLVLVSTSSHRGRLFPFSAVSIKFTISKNYFKNKQEIFNERAR
jgi:hypothetical protein